MAARCLRQRVGMSPVVATNYLLGVASDYWKSSEFYSEYPNISHGSFNPVGRFGIGFLSVFMLGNNVEVSTQRRGGRNLQLRLRGIGSRGSLVKKTPTVVNGTTVEIRVRDQWVSELGELNKVVMARAPMLSIPIEVIQDGQSSQIEPGWWKTIPQEMFAEFLFTQQETATTPAHLPKKQQADLEDINYIMFLRYGRGGGIVRPTHMKWPAKQPELLNDTCRLLAVPEQGQVLLCSKGFAVRMVHVSGLLGMVNIDNLELTASRSQLIGLDMNQMRESWIEALRPKIRESLDELVQEGDVTGRLEFLNSVAKVYGRSVLLESSLPWLTIKEPPGHAHQVSASMLRDRLKNIDEVLISYNVSLWSASRMVFEHYPDARKSALVIPISSAGQPTPGALSDREKEVRGSLKELFHDERFPREVKEAQILLATIDAISHSWDIPSDSITQAEWIRVETAVYGRVRRQSH
jgi:hypothetical protein